VKMKCFTEEGQAKFYSHQLLPIWSRFLLRQLADTKWRNELKAQQIESILLTYYIRKSFRRNLSHEED
jgi:hypothetical protein